MMHCSDNRRFTTLNGRPPAYLGWVVMMLVMAGSSACKGSVRPDPVDSGSGSGSGSGVGSGSGTGSASGVTASAEVLPTGSCSSTSRTPDCDLKGVKTALVACPSGTCDPGSPNGKGVYVAKNNSYCLLDSSGKPRFCPEAFINRQEGVLLELRDMNNPTFIHVAKVNATLMDAAGAEQRVVLQSIRSDKTRLEITYLTAEGAAPTTVTGLAVRSLRLKFSVNMNLLPVQQTHPYEMMLQLGATNGSSLPEGFQRYVVFYRAQGSVAAWYPQCPGEKGPRLSSFLGGKRIDGLTAEAVNKPEAVSFGCETGAIDSCLAWGYTPWNPQPGDLAKSDYLFRSCLQAKRAAYLVGAGDLTSYTVSGTEIRKRDQYGINAETIDRLEAIWTPRGAECLNTGNLRRPELATARLREIPACSNPAQWTLSGKLATGPATTALTAP